MILPLSDVIAAQPHRSYRFGYFGLVLVVRRHEELFFELSSQERRDTMRHLIEQHADFAKQGLSDGRSTALRATGLEEAQKLEVFQTDADQDIPSPEDVAPIMFRSTSSSFVDFKPKKALHFTCLTIGSRGDVQPYIALCQGLIKEGHRCCIASHGEYRKWVESYGIEFKEVGGDPAELMRICVQHGMFTIGFMKEGLSKAYSNA
jgi:sterol 3beta-glucosyltransferase